MCFLPATFTVFIYRNTEYVFWMFVIVFGLRVPSTAITFQFSLKQTLFLSEQHQRGMCNKFHPEPAYIVCWLLDISTGNNYMAPPMDQAPLKSTAILSFGFTSGRFNHASCWFNSPIHLATSKTSQARSHDISVSCIPPLSSDLPDSSLQNPHTPRIRNAPPSIPPVPPVPAVPSCCGQ